MKKALTKATGNIVKSKDTVPLPTNAELKRISPKAKPGIPTVSSTSVTPKPVKIIKSTAAKPKGATPKPRKDTNLLETHFVQPNISQMIKAGQSTTPTALKSNLARKAPVVKGKTVIKGILKNKNPASTTNSASKSATEKLTKSPTPPLIAQDNIGAIATDDDTSVDKPLDIQVVEVESTQDAATRKEEEKDEGNAMDLQEQEQSSTTEGSGTLTRVDAEQDLILEENGKEEVEEKKTEGIKMERYKRLNEKRVSGSGLENNPLENTAKPAELLHSNSHNPKAQPGEGKVKHDEIKSVSNKRRGSFKIEQRSLMTLDSKENKAELIEAPSFFVHTPKSKTGDGAMSEVLIYKLGSRANSTPRKIRRNNHSNCIPKSDWGTPETNCLRLNNSHSMIGKRNYKSFIRTNVVDIIQKDLVKKIKRKIGREENYGIKRPLSPGDIVTKTNLYEEKVEEVYRIRSVKTLVSKFESMSENKPQATDCKNINKVTIPIKRKVFKIANDNFYEYSSNEIIENIQDNINKTYKTFDKPVNFEETVCETSKTNSDNKFDDNLSQDGQKEFSMKYVTVRPHKTLKSVGKNTDRKFSSLWDSTVYFNCYTGSTLAEKLNCNEENNDNEMIKNYYAITNITSPVCDSISIEEEEKSNKENKSFQSKMVIEIKQPKVANGDDCCLISGNDEKEEIIQMNEKSPENGKNLTSCNVEEGIIEVTTIRSPLKEVNTCNVEEGIIEVTTIRSPLKEVNTCNVEEGIIEATTIRSPLKEVNIDITKDDCTPQMGFTSSNGISVNNSNVNEPSSIAHLFSNVVDMTKAPIPFTEYRERFYKRNSLET